MRDKIQAALKHSQADYTEIRLEENESTSVVYRGKNLEEASKGLDAGGIVRCLCRKHGWGVATFNNRDDLLAKVDLAYQCAQVAQSDEPAELAQIPVSDEHITVEMKRDFRGIALSEKKSLIESYNNILLEYSAKIIDTTCMYADSFRRLYFANSEGTFIEEERPMVTIYTIATARRAVDLLHAETVTGGQYPVVINPELAGVFIHEAFGHLSESDFVYENPQAQAMMVLGRRFGQDTLNAFDDGSVPGLRGTHPFDDEGTPTRRNDLIKNGILVGRLHSRQTAAKMGEKPTGNARAIGYRFPPIVRMTNTAIENGKTSFKEMIKDIRLGVYACDAQGGQTALENFSFSSGHAYMIRDGEVAEMVKDVILSGNLFTTLMNIDAIGNDFQWDHGGGGCGKGGQNGLPVSFGAPHVRIQNVVIGGK